MIPNFLKKLINHFGPATLEQAIISATNLIIGLFLVKIWDLATFGQFSLIYLIVVFAMEVQRASIIMPMMSLAPKIHRAKRAAYFSALFFSNMAVSFALSFVVALFVFLSGFIFPKWNISELWWIAGVFILPRLIHEYYRCCFFVVSEPLKSLVVSIIRSALLVAAITYIYTVSKAVPLEWVLWAYIIPYFISSLIGWYLTQKCDFDIMGIKKIFHDHWVFGKWLLATVGVQYATNNMLILVAAAVLGPAIAGAIRAAQHIMGVLGTLFQALENVVPAHTAKLLHENGFKAMRHYLIKIGASLCLISILFVVGIVGGAPWLIPFLFEGGEYRLVVSLINGFAVFYIINSLSLCLVYALRAIEKTRPIFIAYCITAALNMVLAQPLIAHFGGIGVIYGMIGFQIVIVATYGVFLYRYREKAL